jgi:hypothetical protein
MSKTKVFALQNGEKTIYVKNSPEIRHHKPRVCPVCKLTVNQGEPYHWSGNGRTYHQTCFDGLLIGSEKEDGD